jgi:hypothetical protein
MGASAVVFPGSTEAKTLEALACRESIALAHDINARRVRVASDCQGVITSLERGTMGAYTHVVKEIKDSSIGFEVLGFVHENRRSNKEAHEVNRSKSPQKCSQVTFLPGDFGGPPPIQP